MAPVSAGDRAWLTPQTECREASWTAFTPFALLALVNDSKAAADGRRSGVRYETAVATVIAILAVAVSGYTAYVQRQQVRAQVWPILEYGSDNEPELRLWLANKGVGPALIRHVMVTVEGEPGCWTLVVPRASRRAETRRCPALSAATFKE